MKKLLIIATTICLCLSLFAAEGEAEAEAKKDQKPYWTSKNLLYGPGLTFIGLLGITPLGGCGAALHMGYAGFLVAPLIAPMILVDGLIHTATFGLLYNNRNDDDYIADVVDFFPGGEYWKKKKESKLKSKVEDAWQ